MDETYIGGRNTRKGHAAKFDNKEIVIGIRQRNGEMRLFHAEDAKAGTLARYIRENVKSDVDVIITDDFASYPHATKIEGFAQIYKHSGYVYVMGEINKNTWNSILASEERHYRNLARVSSKH